MPLQHYWPVRQDDKCRSIKFAVEWGNHHMQKVTFTTKLFYSVVLWGISNIISMADLVALSIGKPEIGNQFEQIN